MTTVQYRYQVITQDDDDMAFMDIRAARIHAATAKKANPEGTVTILDRQTGQSWYMDENGILQVEKVKS